MTGEDGGCNAVNSFSLVAYLPPPLAAFVDPIRRELVPGCLARAHVTVLPPRPLDCPAEVAIQELTERLRDFRPFLVELGEVELFPVSHVVFIGLRHGANDLRDLHAAANQGCIGCQEGFRYHPHVTLAQSISSDRAQAALPRARDAWLEYAGPRSFLVERLTFVQNTVENRWVDLMEVPLSTIVPV